MSQPNESILVTGGTSGIGAACVKALAEAGLGVWVASRSASRSELPAGTRALDLDVGAPDAGAVIARMRAAAEEELGPLAGFVHSAGLVDVLGVLKGARPEQRLQSEAIYTRALDVHFHGARRIAEALLPSFVERGRGAVVLIDSAAGLRGFPGIAAYAAAKHALLGWARCAALEMPAGISIASVCPYYVDTPMLEAAIEERCAASGEDPAAARAVFQSRNPGGQLVPPGDVAGQVLELLRGDPDSNNGRVVVLDGGTPRDLPERREPGLEVPLTPESLS